MKKSQILYPFRLDEWTLSLLLHQISLFLYHINWEKEKVVCDFANMSKKHFVINLNISGDVTRLPDSETMREQLREIFSISDIKSRCWELRAALATSFCQVLTEFQLRFLNKLRNKPQQHRAGEIRLWIENCWRLKHPDYRKLILAGRTSGTNWEKQNVGNISAIP